jgi:multidrug efflux pump subunit AcrA (membrane-fusion protein)
VNRVRSAIALIALCAACTPAVDLETPDVAVVRGDVVFRASYYGELKARETIDIHAPSLKGVFYLTVETVLPDGTNVEEGQTVLQFDRGPLEDDLVSTQTDLDVAKAQYARVEQELAKERINLTLDVRRKEMSRDRAKLFVVEGVGIISKLEIEKYKLDVAKAEVELDLARQALGAFARKRATTLKVETLKVKAAERKLEETRDNLEKTEIRAPAAGLLYAPYTRLNWQRGKVEPGAVCRPGDKLLEIPDLSAFDAEVWVRQRDASLLTTGLSAVVRPTATPDLKIAARVTAKDNFATTRNERLGTKSAEGNLKEIRLALELESTDPRLRPGGTLRADIEVTLAEDVLLLPVAAVALDGENAFVTSPNGERRPVTIGKVSTTHVEIVEGLAAGDRILIRAASAHPRPVEPDLAAPPKKRRGPKGRHRGGMRGHRPPG